MQTRALDFQEAGTESPLESFARDQLSLLAAAWQGRAVARLWRAADESLSVGRFHRLGLQRGSGQPGLARRLTGGRIVAQGPGVLCLTLATPNVAWLDPSKANLRPDQVLNRALRPVLAALRGRSGAAADAAASTAAGAAAVDAFYPGRDLITVGGRTVAHASFTVSGDGALLVQVQIADRCGFDATAPLLDRFDPDAVAATDRNAFESATTIAALTGRSLEASDWSERLAAALASELRCQVRRSPPCAGCDVTTAHESAFRALQAELGPLAAGSRVASALSMLGVVEVSARVREDRLHDVRVSGDLIAPFHTIDALTTALEGESLHLPALRRATTRILSRPGDFVLGVGDLAALLARLLESDGASA